MADTRARRWLPPTVRIAFGLMWAVDAAFKWSPAFIDHIESYFSTQGQPAWAARYISGWAGLVGHNPYLFAYLLATAETALAVSLIFGLATRAACIGGSVLSLIIWSTAEGFGGPYGPGSTDVGTSSAYVLVFVLLWWSDAGSLLSLSAWRRSHAPRHVTRRMAAGALAISACAALAVVTAVHVSSGPAPSATMDGGQMDMSPGGQDDH